MPGAGAVPPGAVVVVGAGVVVVVVAGMVVVVGGAVLVVVGPVVVVVLLAAAVTPAGAANAAIGQAALSSVAAIAHRMNPRAVTTDISFPQPEGCPAEPGGGRVAVPAAMSNACTTTLAADTAVW